MIVTPPFKAGLLLIQFLLGINSNENNNYPYCIYSIYSMQIGQEWGKQLGEKVVKKLQDNGY